MGLICSVLLFAAFFHLEAFEIPIREDRRFHLVPGIAVDFLSTRSS